MDRKTTIKGAASTVLKFIIILIAAVLVGIIWLSLVYLIPISDQSIHVRESMRILDEEGWYPVIPYVKAFNNVFGLYADSPGILDNYTDGLMIELSVENLEGSCLQKAMKETRPRYWCEFVGILRPVLLFLDYSEIRMLNILLQMFLVAVLAMQLYQRKGKVWCFWALSMYAFLTPYVMGLSLQNSTVFYIGIIGTIALLRWENFWREKRRYLYLFFLLGIVTVYFDFLTYPLFTWALPLTVWISINRIRLSEYMRDVFLTGVCWILGYAGMWAGKWQAASWVLDLSYSDILIGRINLHTGHGEEVVSFADNLAANLCKWVNIQIACILLAWSIWFCMILVKRRKKELCIDRCIPFTVILCGSVAWCYVMRYHTYVHSFFTHRIYCTALLAVLAACICMSEEVETEDSFHIMVPRRVWLSGSVGVMILALLIMTQCKADVVIHNGGVIPRHILLEEGSSISEIIYPRYNEIKELSLGVAADGDGGEYLVEIYDGDRLLFEDTMSFSEVEEGKVYPLPVGLKTGRRELPLCIAVRNCENSNGYVYVTDSDYSLTECSEAMVDGNPLGGQLTQIFGYRAVPGAKAALCSFLLAAGVVWLLAADLYYGAAAILRIRRKGREDK